VSLKLVEISIVADEYSDEMEEMFRESVEGTLRLIDEQIVLIDQKNLHVKVSY
jgi:hypothetical protein